MTEAGRREQTLEVDARRGALWLPLLRQLAVLSPSSLVWKNASSALQGHGDLDVVAPPADWDRIEIEFRRWARAEELHPVAVCRHVPGSMFLLAADPERSALFELDVKARGTFRGATIFRSGDLQSLSEMDPRGFRRLRPGAEGLLKFVLNCTADDGSLDQARLQRERIGELLREDAGGARQAARLFGAARAQVLDLVDRSLRGEWHRGSMLVLQARLRLRLVLDPTTVAQRLSLRLRPKQACCGVKSLIKSGRLVPGDRTGLEQVVRAHAASNGTISA